MNSAQNLIPSIDSRKIVNFTNTIFYAIDGNHNNGHKYISELYSKGVRNFVIENTIDTSAFPEAQFTKVDSTIDKLQHDAQKHRLQFNIPIIGITGSNGKTIVKEWLSQLLKDDFTVCKSPRSYNSQVGVPLSVFELRDFHSIGIFEAGISKVGEMENLVRIIRPEIGIFTNIGSAHDEGFYIRDEKIIEKLRLFDHVKLLIYRKDYIKIDQEVQKRGISALSWGTDTDADIKVLKYEQKIQLNYQNKTIKLNLPFADAASFENLMHCIAFLLYKNWSEPKIQHALLQLSPISMRLEIKKGINNTLIIDDSYNNDLLGLQTALDFLEQNKQRSKRTVILSDMLQSGLDEQTLYAKINELLIARSIERVIFIGEKSKKQAHKIQTKVVETFSTTQEFLDSATPFENELVLIKGARSFEFEHIVKKLTLQNHRTHLEINLEHVISNLNYYRSKLKPQTKIMIMVKAFAYGGGSLEIANALQFHQVDYLAVAYADEGVDLRKNGIKLPIMVMSPNEEDFETILRYNLEPEIYSLDILNTWLEFIKSKPSGQKIHLKVDTGMRRLGVEPEEMDELLQILKENAQFLPIESVFSHLATSDDPKQFDFMVAQANKFKLFTENLQKELGITFLRHLLNSGGIVSYPEMQCEMVRLGIGLYGFDPTNQVQGNLKPIAKLKSVISQIKHIKKGESVGYSRSFKAPKDMTIAVVPIGYADGFPRSLGNENGEVAVHRKRAKVIGNVCMDMIMIDVTDIPCHANDEVELFGEVISILELAEKTNTISYEVLTGISERVKRVYYLGE